MKYIDLWFIWHVVSIFLMISYHIILGRLQKYFEIPNEQDDVVPFKASDYTEQMKTKAKKKISLIEGNYLSFSNHEFNLLFYLFLSHIELKFDIVSYF